MAQNKTAARRCNAGTAKIAGNYAKARTLIVQNGAKICKRLPPALGAAGWGLACGAALPALLGAAPWRPAWIALGLALALWGARAEVRDDCTG